jgi:hypothetical protein
VITRSEWRAGMRVAGKIESLILALSLLSDVE